MGTVLIVDDHEPTCRALARLISLAGHQTRCVLNGQQAIQEAESAPPDVMILDFMMPEVDGLEVLRAIRSNPRTEKTPVILFSAVGDANMQAYALARGANEYWVKGNFDYTTLKERLKRYFPPN